MTRAAVLAVAMLLPATALAGATGAGVPETGGPGAGASSADARGLYYNPAAAVGANGSELDLNMAVNILDVHYQRSGIDTNGTTDTSDDHPFRSASALNLAPVPYFAFRTDSFGHKDNRGGYHRSEHSAFGLGLSIAVPFGRRVTYAATTPGRYHLVRLDYFTAYIIPSFAVRVSPHWRLGAGPIIAFSQYTITQAVDLAPTLQQVMPSNPPPPAESGVLQGELAVDSARAIEPGFSFGTLFDVGDGVATIGAGFLSGSISNATGKAKVTPSQDFAVHANSDFKLRRALPPIVNVGARIRPPETPVEVSLEVQYVAWHVVKKDEITLSNSQLRGDNTEVNNLLNVLGVNQGTLVSGLLDQKQVIARNWHDSVNAILGAEYSYSGFRSRFEIGYDKSAIADKDINPGSLDFDTLVLGASLRYEPKSQPWSAQLAISQYVNQSRTVTNSNFDTSRDPSTGYAFPSGNGTYGAVLTGIGVSMAYRF